MRAVVTGDAGFLGRHFRRMLDDQYTVIGLDLKNGIDCRDFFASEDQPVDLAIHCAAIVGGREVIDRSPLQQVINLALDAQYFEWATRCAHRFIYLSSSAVYPVALQRAPGTDVPFQSPVGDPVYYRRLRESDCNRHRLDEPDALYGWIKLTGERLAQLAFEAGSKVLVLRPFSGYGTDQDETYPFRAFIERARNRSDPFEVWGDGQQVRDFIHVDDLVTAALTLVDQGFCGPINLCTGIGTSFDELARMVTKSAGYDPMVLHRVDQPTGVDQRVGDPTLMHTFYQPQVSIEEGVQRALCRL